MESSAPATTTAAAPDASATVTQDTGGYKVLVATDGVAAIRLVESGVTTVFHSNITRKVAEYESGLREGLRAYVDLGMRVAYAVNIRTQNNFVYQDDELFARSLPAPIQDRMRRLEMIPSTMTAARCIAAFDALQAEFGGCGRVRIVFAPTSPQWCPPELLRTIKRKADESGTGLQMHVLETPYQKGYGPRLLGKSLVAYLRDLGMLGPNVSLSHCVWVTEEDLDILAETGTSVAHNPSCNLRLRSGIAPVTEMLDRGINVGIGTDSETLNDDEDMIQEMRLATKLQRRPGIGERFLTSREALKMATSNGARITRFGDMIGVLEAGREADAVLLRIDRLLEPYFDPSLDIVDAILYRAKSQDVDTVIVAGEPVLAGGKLTRVSKAEVTERLKASLAELPASALAEVEEKRRLVQDLQPFIASFYDGWLPKEPKPFLVFNSRE